jgi:hypothetical protein
MAQTETYSNLLSLIESYHGATLIALEKTRVKHLVNARARSAYRESDLWDQFLVTEDRVVNDSDSSRVFAPFQGTTSATASVTNVKAGDIDTVLRAHKETNTSQNSSREYEVFMGREGAELVGYSTVYGQATGLTGFTGSNPNFTVLTEAKRDAIVGGTMQITGIITSDGSATDALVNANHTITGVTYLTDSQTYVSFALNTNISGFNISAAEIKFPTVHLAYKKQLNVTYGDGAGEQASIPLEWKDYIALGVYADMLASDGFHDKSLAWEGRANKALQRELERIDRNRAHQFINHRVRTHGSDQARQSSHY